MKYNLKIKQFMILMGVAFILFGCARGKEFSVTESQQVSQNTQYPKFTKPKAAVNQFTDEEKEKLTKRLDADKRMAESAVAPNATASTEGTDSSATSTDTIRRETDDILRQIEQGGAE